MMRFGVVIVTPANQPVRPGTATHALILVGGRRHGLIDITFAAIASHFAPTPPSSRQTIALAQSPSSTHA